MKTKILAPLFILLILCACDFPSTIPDLPDSAFAKITFRLKGTVTDKFDKSPVNATVDLFYIYTTVEGIVTSNVILQRTSTDDNGQYNIIYTYSQTGEITRTEENFYLAISASGYKTKKITHNDETHVQLTEEWQTIDIQLEPDLGEVK
jgi:hypothetical protein